MKAKQVSSSSSSLFFSFSYTFKCQFCFLLLLLVKESIKNIMQTLNSTQSQQQQQQHTSYSNNTNSNDNVKKNLFGNFSSNTSLNKAQSCDDIRVQIYYSGLITVIYFKPASHGQNGERGQATNEFDLNLFRQDVRSVCKFDSQQPFTLKWVDEEGDPCTLSSQLEFDEAIRLYYVNKESELVIHVFPNLPQRPGASCVGEDRSIYRRGARRWRKIYLVNGHKYQAKRFARTALCKVCQDRIWGLGRQGYKCLECKIMVHKRCHKFILSQCSEIANKQLSQLNDTNNQYHHQQQQQNSPFVVNRIDNNNLSTSKTMSSLSTSNSISSLSNNNKNNDIPTPNDNNNLDKKNRTSGHFNKREDNLTHSNHRKNTEDNFRYFFMFIF